MLQNRNDAYNLLQALGAPKRLLVHVKLVGEAADLLIQAYIKLGINFNSNLIELGAAIHDAGKIKYPDELTGKGSMHEPAGEILLLANGVQPEVAKCCMSHAKWQGTDISLEERSVALADKLWKGVREENLELCIIDEIASRLHTDRWSIFVQLDSIFEEIAASGTDRLERSRRA
jgi:hypothetical protein